MLTTIALTLALFVSCFTLLGIGYFIKGIVLRGSCGGAAHVLGQEVSCGGCAKKERELCPSDDETGLLELSTISNPHKTLKERHQEPSFQV